MNTTITKRFNFCYGHYLPNHPGKCKNQHGHNAELEVTVTRIRGGVHVKTGMVMDFGDLKQVVSPILEILDHQYLNVLDRQKITSDNVISATRLVELPTAEHIARYIFEEIGDRLPDNVVVEKIRLSETPDSWVEVTQ